MPFTQSNFKKIYLHTHKTLDGAIEFWTKMGFVVIWDCQNDLKTVHMDKEIHELKINHHADDLTFAVKL